VNKYLEASTGLDVDAQEEQLGELTSIYGRDENAENDVFINIYTSDGGIGSTGYSNLLDALNNIDDKYVYVQGEKVFERKNGEWYLIERPYS
jgi:hypothetical protein